MANELKSLDTIKTFLMAGRALFTVENTATGGRFTYKVTKAKENPNHPGEAWFVSVLTGPDNESNYAKCGMLRGGNFRGYRGSLGMDAKSFVAFGWFWNRLREGKELPASVVVRHAGRCCRCGRVLTVPESIDRMGGLGPECAGKMGFKVTAGSHKPRRIVPEVAEALSRECPGAAVSIMAVETGLEIGEYANGNYYPNN